MLGYGYDMTEIDMWWLLIRKDKEKTEKGKLIFIEPKKESSYEKIELLKTFKKTVEVRDYGFDSSDSNNCEYEKFYAKAISDLEVELRDNKKTIQAELKKRITT